MQCVRQLVAIVLLGGTLAGCAGEVAKPVGLDVALRGVEEDMKAAAVVSVQDILIGDQAQEEEFTRTIHHAQCFYRRANPLIPVISKDFTLTLQGAFTGEGRFLVFGVPIPAGGLELSTAKAFQQTLALPVNFTSVSALPDVYLEQKASRMKDLPEAEKARFLTEVFKDREIIRTKINGVISSYAEDRCPRTP